jgi:hypothetical protein
MLPTPNVEHPQDGQTPGSASTWICSSRNRSINTIANRKCNVSIMAKHATADGIARGVMCALWPAGGCPRPVPAGGATGFPAHKDR